MNWLAYVRHACISSRLLFVFLRRGGLFPVILYVGELAAGKGMVGGCGECAGGVG